MAPGTPHPELPARPPGSANLAGNRPVDISLDTLAREADWQDESDVNIRQLFNTIFKRKWMILGIVFLGLAIGYINTLRTQPLYRANATIEIAKEAARILDQQKLPSLSGDLYKNEASNLTFPQNRNGNQRSGGIVSDERPQRVGRRHVFGDAKRDGFPCKQPVPVRPEHVRVNPAARHKAALEVCFAPFFLGAEKAILAGYPQTELLNGQQTGKLPQRCLKDNRPAPDICRHQRPNGLQNNCFRFTCLQLPPEPTGQRRSPSSRNVQLLSRSPLLRQALQGSPTPRQYVRRTGSQSVPLVAKWNAPSWQVKAQPGDNAPSPSRTSAAQLASRGMGTNG